MNSDILARLRQYDHALLQEAANEIEKLRGQLDFLAGQEFDERNFVAMRSKLEVWRQQLAQARQNGESEAAALLKVLGYGWDGSRWKEPPKAPAKARSDVAVAVLHVTGGGRNIGMSLCALNAIGDGDHILYAQAKASEATAQDEELDRLMAEGAAASAASMSSASTLRSAA